MTVNPDCEKFFDDILSRKMDSRELADHLARCPDCQGFASTVDSIRSQGTIFPKGALDALKLKVLKNCRPPTPLPFSATKIPLLVFLTVCTVSLPVIWNLIPSRSPAPKIRSETSSPSGERSGTASRSTPLPASAAVGSATVPVKPLSQTGKMEYGNKSRPGESTGSVKLLPNSDKETGD